MNTAAPSIQQQARISQINGNVQLMRDGFLLPAQAGQMLLPGDRLLTAANAKAMVQFTGVQDALVVEQGAAATFNMEVLDNDQVPQWVARDIEGQGVFFESQPAVAVTPAADTGMSSLFGYTGNNADSTGYPVFESIAGLAVTAAIFSDNENTDAAPTTPTTAPAEAGTNPPANPPTSQNPEPAPMPGAGMPPATSTPEPEPDAQTPLDTLLDPVLNLLSLSTPAPLSSQAASVENPSTTEFLNLNPLS